MSSHDSELYLQRYRDADANGQNGARPAPSELLTATIAHPATQLGQRMRAWLRTSQGRQPASTPGRPTPRARVSE